MKQLNSFKTGDIVEIKNAYFKNDNGLYFVAHSKGDPIWSGNDYSLQKICKNGKLSTTKYNITFWPLCSFTNNRAKNAEAKAWNNEHATIERIDNINNTHVIDYFKSELEKMEQQKKYAIYNFGEDSKRAIEITSYADFYKSLIAELEQKQHPTQEQPTEQTPPEPATEPTPTNNYTYDIQQDTDTRDNSIIFVVKVNERLSKEDYSSLNYYIKSIGGYYSRFKHGFIFKEYPTQLTGETPAAEPQPEPEAAKQPKELTAVYYPINEQQARTAKTLNSFNDYKPNSATTEYQNQVNAVLEIAKEHQTETNTGELQALVNRYSKRLADWYNRYYSIECMCPSVMICGAGNFPVRKKEKQNAAREKHMRLYNDIEKIVDKIQSINSTSSIIRSGDADAIDQLKTKLEKLQAEREEIKAYSKKARQNGTEQAAPYMLQNLSQNIRNIEQRIKSLEAAKQQGTQDATEKYNSTVCQVIENTEIMRIQLIFEGKPDEATRSILKSHAFRWSPSNNAWQRQLTPNAKYSTKQVLKQLEQQQQTA